MNDQIPEPWRSAMATRGLGSIRALSRRANVSVETVRRIVQGTRKDPRPETLTALADALALPVARIAEWANVAYSDIEAPYVPPTDANRLSLRQRAAVDEMIRLLAAGVGNEREEAGGEHEQRSAPMNGAGETPARKDYGLAARPGVAAHLPDTTTGEESQDHGGEDPA